MFKSSGKLRVGVIFGGRSGEHEVSLMSGRSVLEALDPDLYEVIQIGITHEGMWLVGDQVLQAMLDGEMSRLDLATLLPDPTRRDLYMVRLEDQGQLLQFFAGLDVVFPVLHGSFGEDGTLQGLLEMADLAYIGSGVLGSALGMDKGIFKDVMRAHGIPVVSSIVFTRNEIESNVDTVIQRAESLAEYPLFVKPANLGSSVGVSKCRSRSDLLEGLIDAAQYDRRILVEQGVTAREIEVGVLGNEHPIASIPGEVIPSREFYSYEAKYLEENSQLLIPAPISEELAEEARRLSLAAYRAIDCAGMARVDFLLSPDDPVKNLPEKLYLSELNTIPGFTKISMYPKLWQASGISYPALINRLIELAIERKAERDRTVHRFRREE